MPDRQAVGGGRPSTRRVARRTRTFCNHKGNNRCWPRAHGNGGLGPAQELGDHTEGQRQPAPGRRHGSKSNSISEITTDIAKTW